MSGSTRLRVVTYNVHGLRAGVAAVAATVGALAPDILLVQESGSRRRLRRFARAVGMVVAADPASPLRRRVKDAVLVRPPAAIAGRRLLRFRGSRRRHPRGCLVARVVPEGGRQLWALSVHLGLDGAERGRHVRELLALVDELEPSGPVVLGGDLNASPEARAVAAIARRLVDVSVGAGEPTFPATGPVARIDHLFVSAELRVVSETTGAEGARTASDHLPVTADLETARG